MVDLPGGNQVIWDEMRGLYYDRQGREISLRTFTKLLSQGEEYRHLAYDEVRTSGGRPAFVSTVWLGVDTGLRLFSRTERSCPVIFETMALRADVGPEDPGFVVDHGYRYCTERAAYLGHGQVLDRVTQAWWLDLGGRA